MAHVLKQVLRLLFAVQALGIAYGTTMASHLVGARHPVPGPLLYLPAAVFFGLFVAAFWTTRKPLLHRNPTAITACLVNIFATSYLLLRATSFDASTALDGLVFAASFGGLAMFLQREKLPRQILPPARLADIPGDRTWRGTGSIVTLLFVAAAFVLERAWSEWASVHGMFRPAMLLMMLSIACALTVTAVIHESGHALAGAVFGMKLLALTIGPFRWRRRDGVWRCKLSQQIFGGSVSSAPTRPDQPAWQDAIIVLAGPLANLLSAPLFFRLLIASPGTRLAHIWFFLGFMVTLSLVVPVLNLVPFRTATGSYSDGARLLQLFTASPVLEYQRALRALKSTLVTSRRARDLDATIFQRAAALRPAEYVGLHAHVCAAQVLEDQARIPEATREIAAAEAIDLGYALNTPTLLYCIFVFFEAVHNRSAAAARFWSDRMNAKQPDTSAVDYLVAAAALAWIENSPAVAESAWQKANVAARTLPNAGAYNATRDRLALLRILMDQPAHSNYSCRNANQRQLNSLLPVCPK
jgi:hypothetical protein